MTKPGILRRASRRVGRRGAFLALFGVVYLLLGYSYLVADTPQVRHALRVVINIAPLAVYAWVWCAVGAVAVACGLFSGGHKSVGFTAAVIMPVVWSLVYEAAWLAGDLPRGWVTAATYFAIALAVTAVAGMPEPHDFEIRR